MAIPLPTRLIDHARAEGLFPEPGVALLGVSGGPDSIALLDLMHRVAPVLRLELAVAHVDHGIAPASDAVAAAVVRWASRYALPCEVQALHLASASETGARAARYRALRAMQRNIGARYLVTAHQADDQVETVLLRVLKGSGMAGLAGIPARGPAGLTRPLLPFARRELEEWLRERYPDPSLHPAVHRDPANRDPRHDRSWLRQEILAPLRDRWGGAAEGQLLRLQRHALRDREAWAATLRAIPDLGLQVSGPSVSLSRSWLAATAPSLASAVIGAAAREVGCPLGPSGSMRLARLAARAPSGRKLMLGRRWEAEVAFDRLTIARVTDQAVGVPASWGQGDRGAVRWGNWELLWEPGVACGPARVSLETWVTAGSGEIRALGRGDRLHPLGGRGRRPVRRLLMEARVPRSARGSYPVVTRGEIILWLPGVCRSAAAVPRPGEPAMRLEARRAAGAVGEGGDRG